MLTKLIPAFKNSKLIYWINRFLSSPLHIAVVAILLTISSMDNNAGFLYYYILLFTCIIIPFFIGYDMIAVVPLATMLNIGISKGLRAQDPKVIMGSNLPHFIIFLTCVVIFLFGRLIFDLIVEKERRSRFPRFFISYICLLVAFCIGGAFSPYYLPRDFAFGLREFLALGGFYFYYFYTVDFTKIKKSYCAYLLFFFACSVALQILVEAIRVGAGPHLEVGWANRSGLGGTLVASFTCTIYLTIRKHPSYAWLFALCFYFFFTMICLTQCRGAAFTAMVLAIPCLVLILVYSPSITKISTILITVIYIIVMICLGLFEREFFTECFGRLFNFDFDTLNEYSSGRITIWKTGIDQFIHNPLCGVGWYQIEGRGFQARYHNTIIQLLASTGIFGLVIYGYHRVDTIVAAFKTPRLEKTFAYMSIFCILVSSLLDCFLFNIWLGFEYSFLLFFIEGRNVTLKLKREAKKGVQVYQTKTGNTSIIIVNR